jgi:glycerophosphoryl diester phosphodiesterase
MGMQHLRQKEGKDVAKKRNKKPDVKTGVSKPSTSQQNKQRELDHRSSSEIATEGRDALMRETLNDDTVDITKLKKSSTSSSSFSKKSEEIGMDLAMPEIYDPTVKKFENSGKPGTKTKRLERLLEEAEKKRNRLNELKSQGAEGKNKAKEEMWVDALKEASGEKVYHSTTEIRKVYYNCISMMT